MRVEKLERMEEMGACNNFVSMLVFNFLYRCFLLSMICLDTGMVGHQQKFLIIPKKSFWGTSFDG